MRVRIKLALMYVCLATCPAYAISYSLGGSAEIRHIIRQDDSTPEQKTLERLRLNATVDLLSWFRCKGDFLVVNYGGISGHSRPNLEQQWDTFQNANPLFEFEEAYCEISQENWEFTVGKQKFAWGKLDSYQPNDLLNSERFVDPFLDDEDARKIGSPAAAFSLYPKATWLPAESKITVVWEPIHTPAHFPYPNERWFPPAASVGNTVSVPSGLILLPDGSYAPTFSVPVENRIANDSQSFQFDRSNWALRMSGLIGSVDAAFYYYHGIDPEPTFQLDVLVSGTPDSRPSSPLGVTDLRAFTILRPSFHMIDSWGVDVAYPWGDFTFRVESAYIRGRAFNRDFSSTLTNPETIGSFSLIADALQNGAGSVPLPINSYVESDVVEWGLGGDFIRNNGLVLIQVNQSVLLHPSASGLLVERIDTRLLATLQKEWPDYGVTAKLNLLHGIESDYTVVLPKVSYNVWRDLTLEVGYLVIRGRRDSLVGQYQDRDEAFVRALYPF